MTVLVALLLGLIGSPASAVVVRLQSGQSVSYQPLRGPAKPKGFDLLLSNLDYNGGPIMPSNTNYAFYWRPPGAPAYPTGYQAGVNQYFEDLAHDSGGHENVESVAAQYNDAEGQFANYDSHFGGAIVDENPYPGNGCTRAAKCLTDAQLRTELANYVTAHGLPKDLTHEYFIITPPGVEDCFEPGAANTCSPGTTRPEYCAYHSNISLGEGEIIYANDPFVTGNAGCDDGEHPNASPADGLIQAGLSHEHNESTTDPEPNNAWTDFATGEETGFENGDKCRTFTAGEFGTPLGKAPNGAKFNQVINGHLYWYQQEWSNQGSKCLQRLVFSGAEPTATFVRTQSSGNEATFDAAGSTAPGGVTRYSWQFNDESEPEETSSPVISHEFPEPGRYRVALTVYAEDGTSIGTARDIVVNDIEPNAAFTVTTASPTAGQAVGFSASASNDPDGFIVGYAWTFGDGSAGAGSAPSHVYAGRGSYEVTLTVTDNLGASASVTHSVSVADAPGAGGSGVSNGGTQTASSAGPGISATTAALIAVPNSVFANPRVAVNATTGTLTLTTSVADPGTFSWLATFQNGRFGAFASTAKCKRGYIRLGRRCLPARIVFARGSRTVAAAGAVTLTLKPSRSAAKALKNALKRGSGVRVSIVLSFKSARGGSATAHTLALTVKLKK
jgi:PKD repeat protein